MGERNYIVFQIGYKGTKRIYGQFAEPEDATLFLNALVQKYYDPSNIFAISTVEVNAKESVRRYQLEENTNETDS